MVLRPEASAPGDLLAMQILKSALQCSEQEPKLPNKIPWWLVVALKVEKYCSEEKEQHLKNHKRVRCSWDIERGGGDGRYEAGEKGRGRTLDSCSHGKRSKNYLRGNKWLGVWQGLLEP